MIEPLDFITRLREIFPRYEEGSEGCLKFHLLLKAIYGGQGYDNHDHIITEINGVCYDIDGIAEKADNYLPVAEYGQSYYQRAWQTERAREIL